MCQITLIQQKLIMNSPLSALYIFTNTLNQELIRSVHGYRHNEEEEEEMRWVEREFVFSANSCVEIRANPLILTDGSKGNFIDGDKVGIWVCVLAFDEANLSSSSFSIPSFLCFSRNPQLKSIPTLANDLQKVYLLMSRAEKDKPGDFSSNGNHSEKDTSFEVQFAHSYHPVRPLKGNNQSSYQLVPELGVSVEKRRAATDRVASISLSELAKYFNLPITEASRNLKVGLTVLKRKCREFGIPRWPHRKIKSLDTLIHNLQEEVSRQQKDNEVAAAKAARRRQQMLESEREVIERSPFIELQRETKRFRQDVFKRRHKAKALSKIVSTASSSSISSL